MYSMLWFLTLTTVMLTLSLSRDRRSWWPLAAWAAVSAAGFMTHYFFAFPWAACVAWLLAFPGRCGRWRALAATALVVAAISPWYIHVPESLAAWRVTGDWLKSKPGNFSLRRSYVSIAKNYFFAPLSMDRWTILWAGIAVIPLTMTVAWKARSRLLAPPTLLVVGWLLASLLGPAAFDLLRGTYTVAVPRYALSGLPALYLLLAIGLGRTGALTRLFFLVALLVPWFLGLQAIFGDDRALEPYRQVGAILAGDARDTDLVIVHSIPSGVAGIARYIDGHADRSRTPGFAAWVGQLGQRRVPEDLVRLLEGRERARVVDIHAVGEPVLEEQWLREHGKLVSERRVAAATILDFVPKDSVQFGKGAPMGPAVDQPVGSAVRSDTSSANRSTP